MTTVTIITQKRATMAESVGMVESKALHSPWRNVMLCSFLILCASAGSVMFFVNIVRVFVFNVLIVR